MLKNTFTQRLESITQRVFATPCAIELSRLFDYSDGAPHEKNLTRAEQNQLKKYTLAKRQSEYFSGRICAKIAIERFLKTCTGIASPTSQLEIYNDTEGRPLLACPTLASPLPEISISHSKGYAAAIASPHRCGIDIQRQENTLIKVKEKFCSENEWQILLSELPSYNELALLSMLWSAKEAQQKSLGNGVMPGFLQLCLQTVASSEPDLFLFSFSLSDWNNHPNSTTVVTGTYLNYAVGVSIIEEQRSCQNSRK